MDIKKQLQEIYATETRVTEEDSWNTAVHLLILFVALLFAPVSGAIKIVIYTSVTAIVGAINKHSRKVVLDNARTNVYLRGIFYLQRENDSVTADQKELAEFEELASEDPMKANPTLKYTNAFLSLISLCINLPIINFKVLK